VQWLNELQGQREGVVCSITGATPLSRRRSVRERPVRLSDSRDGYPRRSPLVARENQSPGRRHARGAAPDRLTVHRGPPGSRMGPVRRHVAVACVGPVDHSCSEFRPTRSGRNDRPSPGRRGTLDPVRGHVLRRLPMDLASRRDSSDRSPRRTLEWTVSCCVRGTARRCPIRDRLLTRVAKARCTRRIRARYSAQSFCRPGMTMGGGTGVGLGYVERFESGN